MSELQAEQEQQDVSPEAIADTEQPSTEALAPSTEAEQQIPQDTPEEKAQKAIGKQHFKFRQEEREHQKTQAALVEANKKLEELQRTPEPRVPPTPDPFDPGFAEQLAIREQAITAKANYDYEQRLAADAQARTAQEAQAAQHKALQDKGDAYFANAEKLGIDPQLVKQAGAIVTSHGLPDKVSLAILEETEGALMTQYLALHPEEIYELQGMSDWQMYGRVNEIKAKASALKPKQTKAPQPPDSLSGNAAGELEHPLLKGAKFK